LTKVGTVISVETMTSGGTPQAVSSAVKLVRRAILQNVSDPPEDITIGTKASMTAGRGIVLNAPPAAGKGGGSMELIADETKDTQIDLNEFFWVAATTGSELAVFVMDWDEPPSARQDELKSPESARHFYER